MTIKSINNAVNIRGPELKTNRYTQTTKSLKKIDTIIKSNQAKLPGNTRTWEA